MSDMYSIYKEFSDEYLRKDYKPDIKAYRKAIENHNITPEIFNKDESLLTSKEKLRKDLFMKAYSEVQKIKAEVEGQEEQKEE